MTASSELRRPDGLVHEVSWVLDRDGSRYWAEGTRHAGIGSWLEAEFGEPVVVAAVRVWPGVFADRDLWARSNRVEQVRLEADGEFVQRFALDDEWAGQLLELDEPLQTRTMRLVVESIYQGSTWNDTVITRLEFWGPGPDPGGPEVTSVRGSSEWTDESGVVSGEYAAAKAVDGWTHTVWCTNGSGVGEQFTVEFAEPRVTRHVGVALGVGTNRALGEQEAQDLLMGVGRARRLRLTFEDGSAREFAPRHELGLQLFPVEPAHGRWVRVEVLDVVPGTHGDFCLAEVLLLP